MKRRKKESPFVLAAFTIVAGALIGGSVLIMNELPSQVIHQTTRAASLGDAETFQSDNLRFSIELPKSFQKSVGVQYVDFINSSGTIHATRITTNFSTLADYLYEFDSRRKIEVSDEKSLSIDGYTAVSRIEKYGDMQKEEKVYNIFIDGWVYSLSTTSTALYKNIDQIAQTFRYLP